MEKRIEKREAIKKLIQYPERSDNWVGRDCGMSNKTVRQIREELEGNLVIPKLDKFQGRDGKWRPREREKREPEKPRVEQEDAGFLSEPKGEEQFWPGPNSEIEKKVAVMLLDGMGPRQIAEELKVPYGEFLRWYMNRTVQSHLMIKRNDEAERRRRNVEGNIQ